MTPVILPDKGSYTGPYKECRLVLRSLYRAAGLSYEQAKAAAHNHLKAERLDSRDVHTVEFSRKLS
jgi:hypothetical protein